MATRTSYSGSFVPTTDVWDVSELQGLDVTSDKFKEILVRLYLNLNRTSLVINSKDTGYYVPVTSYVNGQLFFPNPALNSTTSTAPTYRQVYRLLINFGALPNTGTKSVAHGLTVNSSYTFTRIYGCASDTSGFNYIPLPYASPTLANNIELSVNGTNVTVTTGSNRSNFTVCYIILEYITQ